MVRTRPIMTKARLDGLYLLLLGSLVLVLMGTVLASTSSVEMVDFKGVYYDTRCLLQHTDPYIPGEPLRLYLAEGGRLPQSDGPQQVLMLDIYPPTTSIFVAPFAMLPWESARMLWMFLSLGSLIFAAFLMWNLGANYTPEISGLLIGFMLANSELVLVVGNMAGIAIGLCVVAVWCFLRGRFVPAGILCLAISLAVKPHDAGFVWLYFLLAGGIYRKRALQTLLVTAVLGLATILWVTPIAPHWMQELHSNIIVNQLPGGLNDPAAASMGWHGLVMITSLQTAISYFRDDPRIYNLVSYLVCGVLLLAWGVRSLRSRFSQRGAWLALAAVVPLTLLVIYHRAYDARLLLLTVPACAMLWAEGGRIGRLALLVNTAGFVLTGDISWIAVLGLMGRLLPASSALSAQMMIAMQVFSAPLILLLMGIFYLWIYVKRDPDGVAPPVPAESDEAPLAPTSS